MYSTRSLLHTNLLTAAAALSAVAVPALALDPVYVLVNQQVGINAVTVPSEGFTGQHDVMSGGMSVGDFNNDTWPDLYISGLGTVPDMLFINQQDGTFEDEASLYGVDRSHMGMGSAVGDVNNDGYPDLYVVSFGPAGEQASPGHCLLYINNGPDENGQYSFREEAVERGVNTTMSIVAGKGAAFGDMDLDGDLDLYVATWQFTPGADGNRIFENDGTGNFTNVSDLVLPETSTVLRGFTPKFVDVTGDRYPELLLTCDFRTSHLFVNNGPDENGKISYRDSTIDSSILTDNNGMGATVNDFNGDGLLDWFQTNIYVSTANYFNTLYMGIGNNESNNPMFLDQATVRGVQDNGWGWGTTSGDYDNDGDVDIVATNGWPSWTNEPTRYWRNDGQGNFADFSNITGLTFNINGRGLVQFDYDKDGDLDLAFVDNGGPFRIYRNDLGFDEFSRYLRIDLNTDRHPCLAPMGYGARVIATYAGKEHLRVVNGESGYLGQSELTLHYGLAELDQVDEVRIEWNDGSVTILEDVAADQQMTVYAYHPLDLTQDARMDFYDIAALLQAYSAGDDLADINGDSMLNIMDIMDFIAGFKAPCQ
jgi:enediyne biosynthesis protein E4